jgi:NodT family efflux transporter outer membrane factor (OMF) lipoprotein
MIKKIVISKLPVKFLSVFLFLSYADCSVALADTVSYGKTDLSKTEEIPPWRQFNDPVLEQLVEQGLKDNPGIWVAKERISLARAGAKAALAPLLPSINAEGAYGISSYDLSLSGISMPSIPGMTPPGDSADYSQFLTGAFKAAYFVDITGRYWKSRQAALKDAEAQIEDTRTAASVLAKQIMQTYYDVVSAKARVKLIKNQIDNTEKLFTLVKKQFRHGIANALDVLQQKQQLAGKKAQLPLALSFLNISQRQLATLAGLKGVDELPDISDVIPVVKAGFLSFDRVNLEISRPDLRAAQRRIEASRAKTSSARRGLMPSLAISGQIGYKMNRVTESKHGDIWNAGAVLSVPIFQGGLNHAKLEQARAVEKSAEYNFQDLKQKAAAEIKNAIEAEKRQKEYLDALLIQHEAASQTVVESKKRYMAGLTTYLNVLAATGTLHLNELSVIQAKRDLLKARINLLSAIGGNWTKKLAD